MNTKQVEELTGMSRQNIRYYERMGLLEPAREDSNAYRDYSEEDVRRLKLIKMLRMLDMPLKEIESVIDGKMSLKEAVKQQKEMLQIHQKQLRAAIEVCASISREKEEWPDVDSYLSRMEIMEKNGGIFARFMDDYQQVAQEEQERKFSFYTEKAVNTPGAFEQVLREYATECGQKFRMIKKGKYPEFMLDGQTYTAVRVLEKKKGDTKTAVRIICERKTPDDRKEQIPEKRRRMLRGIHIMLTNIRRHRKKTVLNVLLSVLTVMVLAFYLGNIESTRQLMKDAPEKFSISGEIWNMRGDMNHGLFISYRVLEKLYESPRIDRISETAELMGSLEDVKAEDLNADIKEDSEEGNMQDDLTLLGINSVECLEGMTTDEIEWEDGKSWTDFQESREECLVSESFAEKTGLSAGDEMEIDLARYTQGLAGVILEREELLPETFHVAGTYKEESGRDGGNPDILLPLQTVKEIYERNDKVYFASSLSFHVADPMELNEVKEELRDAGLKEIIYGSPNSYVGAAVKMTDAVFIHSMERADRSRAILESFLPFVFLIVAVSGYIIPSLLFQNRREEYAVMRALGTGRRFCSLLFYTEHILPAAVGALIGAAAGIASGAVDIPGAGVVWGAYLGFYMIGAGAAMWRFGRFSIAAVLSHRD